MGRTMKLASIFLMLMAKFNGAAFGFSLVRPTSVVQNRYAALLRIGTTQSNSFGRRVKMPAAQDDSSETLIENTPLDRPWLALTDFMSLLGFAAVGKASHAADGTINVDAVFSVAFPFLLAWFATSPFTGVYSEDARAGNLILDTFAKSGRGWVVAVPLGCAIRGLIKGYMPPTSFIVVTLIATFIILGMGRLLFAVLEDFFVELVN